MAALSFASCAKEWGEDRTDSKTKSARTRSVLVLDECFDVVNHAQNNGNGRNGKPSEEHDLEQLNTGVKNDKHGNFLTEKRLLPGRVREL
jgi:hypothetical protein